MPGQENKKNYLPLLLLVAYNLLVAILLLNHEPWRDEWQAVQIGADIHSLPEFIHRLRAEGHPFLWFLLCKLGWSIYPSFFSIQLIHWLITFFTSWLLLFRIKTRTEYKFFFLFGYFMMYEYAVIVRNYGIVVMFALLALSEIQKDREKNTLLLFTGLLGMMFSHIYGLMLDAGLMFYLFYERITDLLTLFRDKKLNLLLAGFTAGALLVIYCLWPEKHAYLYPEDHSRLLNLIIQSPKALSAIWNALINIPPPVVAFRNENIIDFLIQKAGPSFNEKKLRVAGYLLRSVLLLPVLYALYRSFRKDRKLLFTLFFTWGIIYIFQVEIFWGLTRHNGFYYIFLFLLVCLMAERSRNLFLSGLLALQLLCSGWAAYMELTHSFSGGREAAEFINKQGNRPKIIEINNLPYTSTIAAYLKDTRIFINGSELADYHKPYVRWEEVPPEVQYDDSLKRQLYLAENIALQNKPQTGPVFLVLSYNPEINDRKLLDSLLGEGAVFRKSENTIAGEDFYIIGLPGRKWKDANSAAGK